jgi:hypothetical protein
MRALPTKPAATSSKTGAIALQGPHQGAQKSTTTGTTESNTSALKVASVTAAVKSDIFPSLVKKDSVCAPSGA